MLKWSKSWEQWYRRALPAYWVFLFCVMHFPFPEIPVAIPGDDKLLHFVSFGLLAFLFWRFAESFERPRSPRFVWFALVCLVGYACVDEYLQQFVNRGTSLADWLADLTGIAATLAALEVYRRRGVGRAAPTS